MSKKRQIMPINTIGGRIDIIIDELHINAKKFADMINISEGHLSDIRNSNAELSKRVVKSIIKNVIIQRRKINEQWLRTGEGEMFDKNQLVIAEEVSEYQLPERLQELIQRLKTVYFNGTVDEKIKTYNTIDIIASEIDKRREAKEEDFKSASVSEEKKDIRKPA
jgi:hypothetical protein